VIRAKIVLKAADGYSNAEIARQIGIRENQVRPWRKRFAAERLAGLNDRPRSGAPSSFSPSGETSAD
jgi:transposase